MCELMNEVWYTCVCEKMLKDEFSQLNKKLTQLGDVAGQLSAELDPVTSATVTDTKATLDCHADNLQSRLQQLESTMDEHSQFAEKCRVIDTFLKTLPTEESHLTAITIPSVQQSLSAVKSELVNIKDMQPEMARLNELGQELSLADDEVCKLAELNDRWETVSRDRDKEEKELEQRLEELEKWREQCEQWTEFVTCVTPHDLPMCSYQSLLEEQQKTEVPFIRQFAIRHCN